MKIAVAYKIISITEPKVAFSTAPTPKELCAISSKDQKINKEKEKHVSPTLTLAHHVAPT